MRVVSLSAEVNVTASSTLISCARENGQVKNCKYKITKK
jgi:hypothetical protein